VSQICRSRSHLGGIQGGQVVAARNNDTADVEGVHIRRCCVIPASHARASENRKEEGSAVLAMESLLRLPRMSRSTYS
jgi:hypothetical protein